MAIEYKNSQVSSLSATGTSLTLTLPTGLAAGDFMLAAVHVKLNVTTGGMSGWTKVGQWQNGTTGTVAVYWRFWQSGDGNPAVTWTGSAKAAGGISVYTGVHATTPIDVAAVPNTGTSTAPTSLSITPATIGAHRVMFHGVAANVLAESNWNPSAGGFPGFNRFDSLSTGGSTGTRNTLNQWDEPQMWNQALGDMAFVLSASSAWISVTLALRPATATTFGRAQPGADWSVNLPSMSRTINRTPTNGALFLVGTYTDITATGPITSVTIGGLSMSLAAEQTDATYHTALWYLQIPSSSVGTTLVATKSSGSSMIGMFYAEWMGVYSGSPVLDETGVALGTGTTASATTSAATDSQTELAFHANWANTTGVPTAGEPGYLIDMFQGGSPNGYFTQAGAVSGGSTVSASITWGASVNWYSILATFRTQAGAASTDQTFSVAAQVLKTQDQPVQVAAQVRRNDVDQSVLAAAQVRKEQDQTFQTGAQVRATLAGTFLVAAQVLGTVSQPYDVAAQVRTNNTDQTFLVAAQVVTASAAQTDQTFQTAAQVRRNDVEASYQLAAQVRQSIEAGYTVAAQVRKEQDGAFDLGAQVRKNNTDQTFQVAAQVVSPPSSGAAFRDISFAAGTDATGEGTIPAGAQDGDLLIAFISHSSSSASISGAPAGWTLQEGTPAPADFDLWCYTKIKAAGEPAPTWTFNLAGNWTVDIVAYSGVDQSAPVNVDIGEQVAASFTITLGPITPTANDCLLVGYAATDSSTVGRTWTQSDSPSERLDRTDNSLSRSIADWQLTGGSGVGVSRDFTETVDAQDLAGFLLALKPSSGGAQTDQTFAVAAQVKRNDNEQAFSVAAQVRRNDVDAAFTAAAQVRDTAEGQYNVAAQVRKEQDQTYPVGVQVRATLTQTFAVAAQVVDAVVGQVDKTYQIASQVRKTTEQAYLMAAQVKTTFEQTFSVGAQTRDTAEGAYTLAAQVRAVMSPAYAVAAQVKALDIEHTFLVAAQVVPMPGQMRAVGFSSTDYSAGSTASTEYGSVSVSATNFIDGAGETEYQGPGYSETDYEPILSVSTEYGD